MPPRNDGEIAREVATLLLIFAALHWPYVLQTLPGLALVALAIWSIMAPAYGCPGGDSAPAISTGLAIGGYLWVASSFLLCAAYVPMYFVRSEKSAEAQL